MPVTNTFVSNPALSAEAPVHHSTTYETPYVQQWNLSVQQSLGPHWLATISYLGNKSDHLQIRQNPTRPRCRRIRAIRAPSKAAGRTRMLGDVYQIASIGYGNYNALEGELERRFTNGLSMHANYVWSKSMDALNNGASNPQYGPDVQAEYGQSDFNAGQVFKLSGVYELPFGQGKQFLGSANWLTNALVGGWQASGYSSVQSGLPFNVSATDLSDTGWRPCAARKPGLQREPAANQSIAEWFNTSCYVQTGVGQFGNEQRDNIIGPRTTNLDLSGPSRLFPSRKGKSVQFRSDFFDSLNHPLLGIPSATVSASTYGRITSITGARIVQLSLKFIY